MDLQPNKIDGIVKPITNTRISASEWNQLVGSCMAFITAAGFTPDADDNQQFLNAFIQIAQDIGAIGANVDLSNLSATGEAKFANPNLSNVTGTSGFRKLVEVYNNGSSWYKVYDEYDPTTGAFIGKWCEQGSYGEGVTYNASITFLKEFVDANYMLEGAGFWIDSICQQMVYDKVATGFKTTSSARNCYTNWWKASGYIL